MKLTKSQMTWLAVALIIITASILSGCEKPYFGSDAAGYEEDANVTLNFSPYGQDSFTRATSRAEVSADEQCTRLSVAVFSADGTKVKNVIQNASETGFGSVSMSLAAGNYKLVAIAHNGLGNASISSTEKVTFASNKVTDTFAYYGTLTVGDDPLQEDIKLTRRVAMVRLTLSEGALPEGAERIKFYYTGGSSTYNPTTGYGCVQSKQTEYRDCTDEDGLPVNVYELYTLPHEENDALKMTITPLDESGEAMTEVVMENIPVTRNKITTWTGDLFVGGGVMTNGGITITIDDSWNGTIQYQF